MIHVIWDETEGERLNREGRDYTAGYLFEMLAYLGHSCQKWTHRDWINRQPAGLTIVAGASGLKEWPAACENYVRNGSSLLAVGGVYGLEKVLGVSSAGKIREGWVQWSKDGDCPAAGLQSSFHFFDAQAVTTREEGIATWGSLSASLGVIAAPQEAAGYPAITERRIGKGLAAMIGIDLMHTFFMIQQGVPVVRDGLPAGDGSAAINEGIWKTDDGSVLDWQRDRDALEPGGVPFFLHPIVDEWRFVLQRVIHKLALSAGAPLAQVWFWPGGVEGIGHISHDTDGNDPAYASVTLQKLSEAEVKSTWCIIMPGYDADINKRIAEAGHEIALHYNALGTEIPESHWSEEHFLFQLKGLNEQFPCRPIVSNKNHFLRWEGDVQFYRWCERAGISLEQSKGGTKQGNKGFLAGTCHPYVPIETASEGNRPFEVLSLPTLSWDPPTPARCTYEEALALTDRARDVYGVAHFLFHPGLAGISKEGVGDALVELVRYGRKKGLAWWTGEELVEWFRQRRQVQAELCRLPDGGYRLNVSAEQDVQGLTLLLAMDSGGSPIAESPDGAVSIVSMQAVERFGRSYWELVADVAAGTNPILIRSAER
ncbi:hypothetical protein [Paenibacillus contaminans]|uniref:NodB homology domain-containing protein n=1 Tax=Paenibacillus contaminans TaxID=450362 RepID=A0A329MQ49_9BACL|nr:hypothetical protein [Paenibacillus contaminans]RAV21884.1 hypothetical protein DQG23_07470 [Paenibacillus contaminans]